MSKEISPQAALKAYNRDQEKMRRALENAEHKREQFVTPMVAARKDRKQAERYSKKAQSPCSRNPGEFRTGF